MNFTIISGGCPSPYFLSNNCSTTAECFGVVCHSEALGPNRAQTQVPKQGSQAGRNLFSPIFQPNRLKCPPSEVSKEGLRAQAAAILEATSKDVEEEGGETILRACRSNFPIKIWSMWRAPCRLQPSPENRTPSMHSIPYGMQK